MRIRVNNMVPPSLVTGSVWVHGFRTGWLWNADRRKRRIRSPRPQDEGGELQHAPAKRTDPSWLPPINRTSRHQERRGRETTRQEPFYLSGAVLSAPGRPLLKVTTRTLCTNPAHPSNI